MPDPVTFESRLAEAFERWADRTPNDTDPAAVAAAAVLAGRREPHVLARIVGRGVAGGSGGRASRGWRAGRIAGSSAWPESTRAGSTVPAGRSATATFAAFAGLIVVLLIVGAALLAGAGHPAPSPTLGPRSTPTPTAPASPVALSAPLGFKGTGVIEFTRHNAAGGDDLWLIDPAGTNGHLLVPGGCCGLFSPDGRQLAAAVPGGGLVEPGKNLLGVNVYPQPGATVGNTIPAVCGGCGIAALNSAPDAWSADGSQVAIDIWSDSDPTQDGMAIAGAPPGWLFGTGALGPNEAHRDLPIAFSPDGKLLLFMREEQTAGPTSIGPLFLLTIAQRSARQLTPPGMTVSTNGLIQGPASWSPDGTKIAFAAVDPTKSSGASIYVTGPSNGARLTTVVPGAGGATSAHFSPDGSWIAYDVPAAGGFHDLHVVHPDGSGDRNLTGKFDPGVCCGQWSPDGNALLVTGTSSDDVHSDLFIVSLLGDVRQVTQSPNAYTAFLWGPGPP